MMESDRIHLLNGNGARPPGRSRDYVTREQMQIELKAAMIEIVGPLAHSFLDLERRHIALCQHLGLTYNPPGEKPDLSVSDGGATDAPA